MKLASTAVAAMLAAVTPLVAQAQTIPLAQGQGLTFNDQTQVQSVDVVYAGGYGQIDFSQGPYDLSPDLTFDAITEPVSGAQGFLNHIKATTNGTGGAVVSEFIEADDLGTNFRVDTFWQDASAEMLSVNAYGPQAGQFGVVGLSGGMSLTGPRLSGKLSGGAVQFSNLRVDLVNQQVIADVSGLTTTDASFSRPDTPIWSFASSVAGPTSISLASLRSSDPVSALQSDGFTVVDSSSAAIYQQSSCFASGSGLGYPGGSGGYWYPCTVPAGTAHYVAARADLLLDNLELTNAGAQVIVDGLGIFPSGNAMTALAQVNTENGKWGSMRVGLFFRAGSMNSYNWPALPASIPEPSTYLMMGLGLVGVLLAKRR
jgi:PEP-CTERM motif